MGTHLGRFTPTEGCLEAIPAGERVALPELGQRGGIGLPRAFLFEQQMLQDRPVLLKMQVAGQLHIRLCFLVTADAPSNRDIALSRLTFCKEAERS